MDRPPRGLRSARADPPAARPHSGPSGARVVTPDGLNLVTPPPPRDPRLNDAAAIGAVLATLEQLTTLLSVAPGEPLVYQLLGLTSGAEPES